MDFTREPIIETVISPQEGSKLILKNSKGAAHEEYIVDAIEVVTFAKAVFYRCLERPKAFLLPVEDYEIVEAKDARMILKAAEMPEKQRPQEQDGDRRRKKMKKRQKQEEQQEAEAEEETVEKIVPEEVEVASSQVIRRLFPPPATLIKEKFNHLKAPAEEVQREPLTEAVIEEKMVREGEKSMEIKEEISENNPEIQE